MSGSVNIYIFIPSVYVYWPAYKHEGISDRVSGISNAVHANFKCTLLGPPGNGTAVIKYTVIDTLSLKPQTVEKFQ